MALGKNMKVDRLIPLAKVETVEEVVTSPTEEDNSPVSVSLDEFFGESNMESVGEVATSPTTIIVESQPEPQAQPESQYKDVNEENLKIIFKPSRRKTQKRILIDIEGALTINNVELLYSKVNDVFENYDYVEVTMKNVTEIDLTVVQLFHAIRVSYWPLKKYISINAEFSRDDRKLLNACGFTEFQTQVIPGA